jgi:hypothetical protein
VTIILLAVMAVAVVVPVACLVLVSIASLREDGAHSLGYKPAGAMQAAARRMLGFHGDALTDQTGVISQAQSPEFIDNTWFPADSGPNGDADHLDLGHLVG